MFLDLEWSPQALLINLNQKWNSNNSHVIVCIFVRAIGYGWKQAGVGKEHEGHNNAIRRRANMLAVKFLNVTVPCSFTSDSNECITEATGWSQCKGGPPPSSRLASLSCESPPLLTDHLHYIRYLPQNIGCSNMEADSLPLASTVEYVWQHAWNV